MLKQICDALTALRQYILQTHWSARGKAYSTLLLTDRLYSGLSDDIDRLKELSIGSTNDLSIADAESTFKDALAYIRALSENPSVSNTQAMLRTCMQLENAVSNLLQQACEYYSALPAQTPYKAGILNALGDIDEKRLRDIYLIKTELEQ